MVAGDHLPKLGLPDVEDNILRKLRHELIEIEGQSQDLHHLQQDLERQGETLSICVNSIKRSLESVDRLIEDQRMHRKRREDLLNEFKSLFNSLQSNQNQKKSSDINSANSSTTKTDEDEESEKSNDSDAAKILIDLSAKEQEHVSDLSEKKSLDLCKEQAHELLKKQSSDLSVIQTQTSLGCRFTPTDAEIIMFLKNKIAGKNIPVHITERDLYGSEEPAVIFGSNPAEELFFVTQIKKKFESGRTNSRVVGNGTWKIQNNKNVYEDATKKDKVIGHKRALNYVDENTKRDKISWIMYEYNLCSAEENPERWVICRIKRGKGNRIGLDSLPKPTQNGNGIGIGIDSLPRTIQNAKDDDLKLPEKRLQKANEDDLRLLKKRKLLETMDLSLSLGLPSENMSEEQKNGLKDQDKNLFEHSRSSSPWGTFI